MQIYALEDKRAIVAAEANRHKNYRCPECLGALRVRGGPHRQTHFYHLKSNPACRQSKKTFAHLQVQRILASLLPGSMLEKPFPEKGRIADLVWEQEKLVIEVQCSPLSLEEAKMRCRDYQDLGYQVVWVLHDKRFNQKMLSAAEDFLRRAADTSSRALCYFTNIDEQGIGEIYDQFEVIKKGKRYFKGPPLRVDLSKPCFHPVKERENAPDILKQRPHFHFAGDLLDRFQKNLNSSSMERVERRFFVQPPLKQTFLEKFKKIYAVMLHSLLEITQK